MKSKKTAGHIRKKSPAMKKALDWKPLYGLGKDLWKGEDAQAYVDRLREGRPASS